jgi:uncharacterized protein (TIGR00255 family)
MTGFGYGEYQDDVHQIILELKGYNNRYLDVYINLPVCLSVLEPRFREFLTSRVGRGRVELNLRHKKLKNELSFVVDNYAIAEFADTLREIAKAADIEADISLSNLLAMDELVKPVKEIDPEEVWEITYPLLDTTYRDFEASRKREGLLTERNILEHLSVLSQTVDIIREKSAGLEMSLQENIRSRFETVLGNSIDEDRVLAETAVLLVKFSVDEELSRLSGHLEAFRQTAAKQEPVGKRLDFLCQELNREINTVGSKSTLYEINSGVVDAKDALEKIREQLRNVE